MANLRSIVEEILAEYPLLDMNGLLFLLKDIYGEISKKSAVTIATAISEASTNEEVAGAKAVYDLVVEKLSGAWKRKEVETLPEIGEENIIYMLPATDKEGNKYYKEYWWTGTAFELFGDTTVDLSDYVKKSDIYILTNEDIQELINAAKGDTV